MTRPNLFIFLLSGMTWQACNLSKDNFNITESDCNDPSSSMYRSITQDDITREYLIHVPDEYNGSAVPLLLAFHGNAGCADNFATYEAQLEFTSRMNGFILVYPQGIARDKGNTEWDPGDDGSTNISTNDLAFVDTIIADVSSEYAIDSSQIYAAGYSNGGMMAYGLACARAEQIAAVGIMSGTMLQGDCDPNNYTSVIHFHGTTDESLPYQGNQDFQSIPDVINYWVSHNNTDSSPTTTDLGGGVSKEEYTGGNEDTSVVLYTIENGLHVWFREEINGQEPNQILWDFLAQYTLTGSTPSQ